MQRVWSTYLEPGRVRPPSPGPVMDPSTSPRTSISSHAPSIISQAPSTRPILSDMSGSHDRSNVLYRAGSPSPSREESTPIGGNSSNISLTVNYLPSKFSNVILSSGGTRKRKIRKGLDPIVPKLGGGYEAFKNGEARMPTIYDDDNYDITRGWLSKGARAPPKKPRWNTFKCVLFAANFLLSIYSLVTTVFCLLTWFDIWAHADVVRVANRPELVTSTIAGSVGIVTSLIGWSGILLNNRSFLAVYTFMLWICFAFLVIPGYITYKRKTFNLEGKINAQWSREFGPALRLRIQNQLACCGYFSPFVEATISQTCYARSILPGCKLRFLTFERFVLERWYTIAFALVPLHIFVIVAGLLCSNHVTYRFGKGMMPKAYRLSMNSMAVIMDNYANQLADQYGAEVASEVLARSRTHLPLDSMPTSTYNLKRSPSYTTKYDPLGSRRAPEGAS